MKNGRGRLYLSAALCMLVALSLIKLDWVQVGNLKCILEATPLQQIERVAKLLEFLGMDPTTGGKYMKEARDPCPSPSDGEGTVYKGSPQQGSMSPIPPPAAAIVIALAAIMIALTVLMFYRFRRRQPSGAW